MSKQPNAGDNLIAADTALTEALATLNAKTRAYGDAQRLADAAWLELLTAQAEFIKARLARQQARGMLIAPPPGVLQA